MRLTPFNLTQNISVDNALSTIQVIHQLIAKLNDVVNQINNINSTANQYTDSEILKVKNIISSLENELKTLINSNASNIELLQQSINLIENAQETLKNYIDNEVLDIVKLINSNYKTLCGLYSSFKAEILEILETNEPLVTNPTNGLKSKMSKCLLDVYTSNRVNTLDLSVFSAIKIGDITLNNNSLKLNTTDVGMVKSITANELLPNFTYTIQGISAKQNTRFTKGDIRSARLKPIDFMMNLLYWCAKKHGVDVKANNTGNNIYDMMYSLLGTRILFSTAGWYADK